MKAQCDFTFNFKWLRVNRINWVASEQHGAIPKEKKMNGTREVSSIQNIYPNKTSYVC